MAEDANAQIRVDIDTTAALASIKNLQRQISAFHSQMLSSGNAANAALSQNMQKTLVNSINATGKFAASLTNIKSSAENFTASLEKNKLGLREYFRYAGASTQSFGKLFKSEFATIEKVATERVKTLQTQYIKMGRDANGALQAIKVRPLTLDMQNLGTQTAIAAQKQMLLNQLIKQGTTNLVNWGKNVQWAGRQLMVGFTLPLALLGTKAAQSFMELEKQAVRFKRVYGEMFTSSGETEKALQEVRDLADEFTRYGVAVEKTLGLAADLAQQGFAGVALMSQVTQATRLAVLGEVEQQEALETTISLTNAFGVAAEDLASKINFLNAVENQTVTAIEDLTIAIPKAGPVVQQLGGDVEDLAFFLTAMKEGGINASEGANALKSGLASLINPTRQASDMLAGFGINVKGIVDANRGDVQGIVVQFAKALDDLDPLNRAQAIEQMFGKFQFARLSTLFQNVIKEGSQANRVLELGQQTAEELAVLADRELKKVEDSPAFKFQKAVEDITVALAPLGEQFLKLITPVVEFVTEMLKKFNNMSEGSKTFVAGLIATLGLVAPVLLMTVGLVANGVGNLIKGFNQLRLFYNKLGGDSSGLASSTSYLTQEQLEAAAVAASLGQSHAQLAQIFTAETQAVQGLIAAYQQAVIAANALSAVAPVARARPEITVTTNSRGGRRAQAPQGYKDGVVSVPGPKGAGDVVPAMLAPGEAVIPAEQSEKYGPLIASIVADNVPGYRKSNVDRKAALLQDYEDWKPGRNQAIPTSRAEIDQKFPGRGTQLVDRLAEADVSKSNARKILSSAIQAAGDGTEEALQKFNELEAVLIEKINALKDETTQLVKDSAELVKQVRTAVPYKPNNAGAKALAHIGSGTEMSAREALKLQEEGRLKLSGEQDRAMRSNQNAMVNLKSGFGMSNFDQGVNTRLNKKEGVSREEFQAAFREAGDEKWNPSIQMGGGDPQLLAEETARLNQEFDNLITSLPEGTRVLDKFEDAAALRDAKIAAVSVEELWSKVRANIQSVAPNVVSALDTSAQTVTEVRSEELKLRADPAGRRSLSKKNVGLDNTPLKEVYSTESSRDFDIEQLNELATTSEAATKKVKEQSLENTNLSTATESATKNIEELKAAVNNLGLEVSETANQFKIAATAINSVGTQIVGPRRAQAAQGPPTGFARGTLSVPGPKGAGDVVPAMLAPGEAVIPAKVAQKYAPFIQDMIAGNIPGFMSGVFLGMPKSSKSVSKGRTAADQIYELFKQSSYANTPPTEYGHQISPTAGHSFPLFGLGGVYQKGPKQVFVKPVMDETAAMAEMRATTIARQAHGLKAPEQKIVVIRDPMDVSRQRRFIALESDLDPTFVNTEPMGVFNEEQYFRQLAASLLRADKDLSPSNVYGDVVADVGPAGVFDRASGLRQYSNNLPSMEDQALINLLGIKGGAKRAFAESTLGLMSGMTAEQYHQKMIGEIQKVLPKLRATIASFGLTNPTDIGMYDDMVRRLEAGLSVDWRKFHAVHSSVVIPKAKVPKVKEPAGYAKGVVSVPGPKGAGDVVPAMLSPGEAVIPTAMAEKYGPLINSMISGNVPGYKKGRGVMGAPQFDSNPFGSSEIEVTPDKKAFDSVFRDGAKRIGDAISSKAKGIASAAKDYATKLPEKIDNSKFGQAGSAMFEKFLTAGSEQRAKESDLYKGRLRAAEELLSITDAEYANLKMQQDQYKVKQNDLTQAASITQQEVDQAVERRRVMDEKEKIVAEELRLAKSEDDVIAQRLANNNQAQLSSGSATEKDLADRQKRLAAEARGKNARLERRQANQRKFQAVGGKVSQVGMMASMAVGAASMVPGKVGETAQQLAGPIMALSSLAMFIQGPVTLALVSVVAVLGMMAFAIIKTNEAYKQAQTEAVRLQEAIGGSTEAVRKLAEFSGKVTAGEVAEKRRESKFQLMGVAPGKTTFGESFMKDESGVALLKDLKMEVANSGGNTASALQAVSSQLSMAVVSGALSQAEAGSIASQIGLELNDASFAVQVRAEISELIGPDGTDLATNELVIATRLADTARGNMEASRDTMNKQLGSMGGQATEDGRTGTIVGLTAAGAGGGAAAGAGIGATIGTVVGSIVPGIGNAVGAAVGVTIGSIVGTIAGGITGAVTGMASMEEMAKKAGAYSGAYVADMAMALQQQNEIMAVLDQNYSKKMNEAAIEGDITEYKRLQLEYEEKKRDITAVSADLSNDMIAQYDQMKAEGNVAGTEAIMSGLKGAADVKFAEDPTYTLYKDSINESIKSGIDSGGITEGQEIRIRSELLSGMDPATLNTLLNSGDISKVVNLITNLGGPMATEVGMVANMIKDEDVSANFLLRVEEVGADSVEAQKLIDLAAKLQALGGEGVMENSVNTIFTAVMDDSMASAEISKTMEALESTEVETVEQVYNIVPEFNVDGEYAEAFNEDYFATLQNNAQRETYVLATKMIMEIPQATLLASPDFIAWTNDLGARHGDFPEGGSLAQWQQWYADDMAQKVTTSGIVMAGRAPEEPEEPSGGGGGPSASPLDDMLKRLRDVRKSQIEVTKGFDASSAALDKLFGGNKGINLFDGLEQSMRRLGAGEDLISAIAGMDPEEFDKKKKLLFNFDKQTGAIIGFKDKLMNIGKALSAIALGDYVNNQQKSAKESKNQIAAFDLLRSAGYSVAEAYEAVQDAAFAAALASGNVTREQLDTMRAEMKAAQEAAKQAARLTPEGMEEVFTEGFNKAMEAFDVEEKRLTLEYELKSADDQAIVRDAESQIAAIRYQMDDYEADLKGIQDQEDSINDTYDEKLEALEKVRSANQKILDQEKGKLSVAEAITRGDLAAAARAVQDVRATSASGYFSSQTDALEAGRKSALDAVRDENGLSRVELEEKLKDLADEIFEIEEKALEPAQERLRLAQEDLAKRIRELEVLGHTKAEWETIKNSIDTARVNSDQYKAAMTEALGIVEDARDAWNGITNRTVTLTVIQKTVTEGDTSPGGPGGPGGPAADPAPTGSLTPAQKAALQTQINTLSNSLPGLQQVITNAKKEQAEAVRIYNMAHPNAPKALADRVTRANTAVAKAQKAYDDALSALSTARNQLNPPSRGPASGGGGRTGPVIAAEGGPITGPGTGTSDSIPAMLSDGEYVIKAASAKKLGRRFLDSVNAGKPRPFPGMIKPRPLPAFNKPYPMPQIIPDDGMVYAGGSPYFNESTGMYNKPRPLPAFNKPSFKLPGMGIARPSMPQIPSGTSFDVPNADELRKQAAEAMLLPQPPANNNSSVYNYNLSVNVASQSDPNTIAQTVMAQLQRVDSQRIRNGRL
jgi:TP901 family phage tail tape measure protein